MPTSSYLLLLTVAVRSMGRTIGRGRRIRCYGRPISIPVVDSLLRKHLPQPLGTTARIHGRLLRVVRFAARTEAFALVVGAVLVHLEQRLRARTTCRITRRPR